MTAPTTVRSLGTPFTHEEAMDLQREELTVTLRLLESLSDAEWRAATDCPGWDVRTMYLHVLGACEGAALPEQVRQLTAAKRRQRRLGGPLEASLSAVQIDARVTLSPSELVARLEAEAPKTVRRRTKLPRVVRRVKMKVDGPVVESWSFGYLSGTIYLRDLWMHRIDACRATGRTPELTAGHDGRIVADVVTEWARRHGAPFALELTGPAGGVFRVGDGPAVTIDAVEFCRTLAGRCEGEGLLATIVPF